MIVHKGGCHCGKIVFEFEGPENLIAYECNCSKCYQSGLIGIAVPKRLFKLLKGKDSIITYTFNTHVAQHYFCSTCGIESFYIPRSDPAGYEVNARCMFPGTIQNLEVRTFNGQDWEKEYKAMEDEVYPNFPDENV